MKQKFYQTTWFTILLLIFFFPVGLFLMWKYKKFNKIVRILITILLLAAAINVLADPATSKDTNTEKEATTKPTTEEATKATTKPTTAATTAKPKTSKQIKKEFIKKCKTYKYKSLKRNPDKYQYKNIVATVKISQVINDGGNTAYRCYVYTGGEYVDYDTNKEFYIVDDRKNKSPSLLEEDVIKVYGIYAGNVDLQRALTGTTDKVPGISMMYVKLISE